MGGYRIISSDNHVFEPRDLWTDRVEAKYKHRAPHVVRMEDGTDRWFTDGIKGQSALAGAQVGLRFEEPEKLGHVSTMEDVRPGGYIPEEQIKDMDADGVDVSILYPTVGLQLYCTVPDSELLSALFRAYNDWLAEFCQPFPNRLKGIAMVNVDDVQDGVSELERTAKLGLAGAMITIYPPEERQYDSPEYEPLWAAAQDLRMPLSLHITTNRPGPGQQFMELDSAKPAFFTNVDYWVRMSLGYIIFGGVFERYPALQVGSVEQELSWVPHFLDRMDYTYTQRAFGSGDYRFKRRPASQRLLPHQRVSWLPGRRSWHSVATPHRSGQPPVGFGLSPPGVHLSEKPRDHRGDSRGLHRGGESQDCRRERCQNI